MQPSDVDIALCSCPEAVLAAQYLFHDDQFEGIVIATDAAKHIAAEMSRALQGIHVFPL